jgi:hypothetical protein
MSGMSFPAHFAPVHQTSFRFGSHGFPDGSQDARLYMIRRFAGQAKPQPGARPRPLGSEASRRAIMLPACVNDPQ